MESLPQLVIIFVKICGYPKLTATKCCSSHTACCATCKCKQSSERKVWSPETTTPHHLSFLPRARRPSRLRLTPRVEGEGSTQIRLFSWPAVVVKAPPSNTS